MSGWCARTVTCKSAFDEFSIRVHAQVFVPDRRAGCVLDFAIGFTNVDSYFMYTHISMCKDQRFAIVSHTNRMYLLVTL